MKRLLLFVLLVFNAYISIYSCDQQNKSVIHLEIDMKMEDVYELLGEPQNYYLILDTVNDDWDVYRAVYDGLEIHYCPFGQNTIYQIYIYSDKYEVTVKENFLIYGETKASVENKMGKEGYFWYKNNKNHYVYLYEFPKDLNLQCYYDYNDSLRGVFLGYD